MKQETVAIDRLSPDPANVRKHPHRNLRAITASLVRFGQQRPVVAERSGTIRRGSGVWHAAKELKWSHLNVVWTDLAGSEATAYAIASNRTAELAAWNLDRLVPKLHSLKDEGIELEAAGFSAAELAALTPVDGTPAPAAQVLRFNHIFDTVAQQTRWFYFVNHIQSLKGLVGETLAARLDEYLVNGGFWIP